jgi:hypothetical protein
MYWTVFYTSRLLGLDLQTLFFSRLGACAVAFLVGTVWWWSQTGLRLRDRAFVAAVFIVSLVVPAVFGDPSVGPFGMFLFGGPVILTAAVLGLVAARDASNLTRRNLIAGSMLAASLGFLLIRMDGVQGNADTDFAWRWSETAEDRFLAEHIDPVRPPVEENVAPLVAEPGDWINFRGPHRAGAIKAGFALADWKSNPPQLVWKKRVGPAWSSVIVVGGKLFTQEQRGEKEAVTAYDAATGEPVWVYESPDRYSDPVSGAGPRATPTFADGRIFAFGSKAKLVCLEASSGQKVWERDCLKDSEGEQQMWGFASSPLVVDDLVVVFAGGEKGKSLLAYHRKDGELAWSADGGKMSYCSAELAEIGGVTTLLFSSVRGLLGFDPSSGRELWQTGEAIEGTHSVQPHFVSLESLGQPRLLAVTPQGVAEHKIVNEEQPAFERGWLSKDLKPDFNDFVVLDEHAYGFDREIFACISLRNGKRAWKGGRYGHGQVVLLEDERKLIVLGEQGQLALLNATPKKLEELGQIKALEGKTWNHPVLVGRRLYCRNAEEMACYELAAAETP